MRNAVLGGKSGGRSGFPIRREEQSGVIEKESQLINKVGKGEFWSSDVSNPRDRKREKGGNWGRSGSRRKVRGLIGETIADPL